MNRVIFGVAVFLLFFQFNTTGQSVRRSVISSFGDSGTAAGGIYMSCTAGQPPNAGTIKGGGFGLRQGFQQPPNSDDSIVDPDCIGLPLSIFDFESIIDACGEHFSFTYMDVPESNTTFLWDFGPDGFPPTSTFKDPVNVGFATTGVKTVSLTVTTGDCVITSYQQIDVTKAAFGAFVYSNAVSCPDGSNGSLNLVAVNGTAPYAYKWSTGASTPSISDLTSGSYGFTVTDAAGCKYEAEGVVAGPDDIDAGATVKVETCTGAKDGEINLNVTGGNAPYIYSWADGETTEDRTGLTGGLYLVTISDANGCEAVKEVKVATVCEDFVFTNLITPNGDGANDTWIIPGIENFPDTYLQIFNRWGDLVYDTKAYSNTWQGTNNNGKPLPVGAYFYLLELNDAGGTTFSGSISILR